LLAAVAAVALAALVLNRRGARYAEEEDDTAQALIDLQLADLPGAEAGSRAPGALMAAWVQFLRTEVEDAANALNNRLAAIGGIVANVERGQLERTVVGHLEQVDIEIKRANAITAGLLRRVSSFAPDTIPTTYRFLRDAPVRPANILVVEDDASNREVITRMLENLGHRVTAVRDGIEAWHVLEEADMDCVICDIRMPGLGGRALFEQVEEQQPQLASRFVFVTGDYTRPGTREFLERSGCSVVPKPFEVDTLLGAIAETLERVGVIKPSSDT